MIDLLSRQIGNPIEWQKSIQLCLENGVNQFVQIGPKRVLSRLVEQTAHCSGYENITITNIDTMQDLESFML